MQSHSNARYRTSSVCWLLLVLVGCAGSAAAQSTDIAWPTPVRTNEASGVIPARDLGDPRVTDHYFAFTGTPGDVLITVEGRNLNGDVDVFTLSGLRPLLKFTVYAESSSPSTKSIFLRTQQDLILRIEGRTPNDDPASYRISFGGAFSSITSGPLVEHEAALAPAETESRTGTGGRRVTSAGARIDEPRTEVAETPAPQPTPEPVPLEPRKEPARTNPRNRTARRPAPRRTRPATTPPATEEQAAKSEPEDKAAETAQPPVTTPRPSRRTSRRTPTVRKAAPEPAAPAPEVVGPRLVIETSDGTLVDRDMNTVRRVTVENGQVVVLGKDGKVQRIPLASVVRMTIAP